MVHQHIGVRSIDRASAYLHHSCFLIRFSGSTGFPPFFSLVFMPITCVKTTHEGQNEHIDRKNAIIIKFLINKAAEVLHCAGTK